MLANSSMDDLKSKAQETLQKLWEENDNSKRCCGSGSGSAIGSVDGENNNKELPLLRFWVDKTQIVDDATCSARCRFFQTNGFVPIPGFCTVEECRQMKDCMIDLVEKEWKLHEQFDSFGTDAKANTARGDYFLNSAENVHFFAESCALEEEENKDDRQPKHRLRPEYRDRDKVAALNKAGHALHCLRDSIFHEYSFSEKLHDLVSDLGWKDPVLPQSMYIFKQPRIGGAVTSHQDSTFLYTEPRQTCLGLWLALDDATLQNGTLWVRPKSHNESVRRQFKRNPAHFGVDAIESRSNDTTTGDINQQKLVMEELYDGHYDVTWDGGLPGGEEDNDNDDNDNIEALLEAGFVPVECKAGDLLCFCGELDHLSLPNRSDEPRHTYQLHLVEGPNENVVWSKYNWLQYSNGKSFPRLVKPKEEAKDAVS